jgi:hypothetical protein
MLRVQNRLAADLLPAVRNAGRGATRREAAVQLGRCSPLFGEFDEIINAPHRR